MSQDTRDSLIDALQVENIKLKEDHKLMVEALEKINSTDLRPIDSDGFIWLTEWRNYTKKLADSILMNLKYKEEK